MARDILEERGETDDAPETSTGGQQQPKDMPYSPPQGPVGINDPKTSGIHGSNHGNCGTQGKH